MSITIDRINKFRSQNSLFQQKKSILNFLKGNQSEEIFQKVKDALNNFPDHSKERLYTEIAAAIKWKPCIFNEKVEVKNYKSYNGIIYRIESEFPNLIKLIFETQAFTSEEKLDLLLLFEFSRIGTPNSNDYFSFSNHFGLIPEKIHGQVLAIQIWSSLKHHKLPAAFKLLTESAYHSEVISDIVDKELEEIFTYIFNYYELKLDQEFIQSLAWSYTFSKQCQQRLAKLPYQERLSVTLSDISAYETKDKFEDKFNLMLAMFITIEVLFPARNTIFEKLVNEAFKETFKKLELSESQITTLLYLLTQFNIKSKLGTQLSKQIEQIISKTNNEEFVKLVLRFYDTQHEKNKNEGLKNGVRDFYRNTEPTISWNTKLNSGFENVAIPMNHNPYKGLHHTQVRPYFSLISQVANVDIIKFYKVDKVSHVRFRINENIYSLNTGDGFSLDFGESMNLLLFQEKIPYQFVVISNNPNIDPKKITNYNGCNVITLFNEIEFNTLKSKIRSQNIAGWATPKSEIIYFQQHISEIGSIKARPDLDNIDLSTDPKFITIKDQIDNLEPIETWTKLIEHLMQCPLDSKPGKRWDQKAKDFATEIGKDNFIKGALSLHNGMIKGEEWFQDDEKLCGLRGLSWLLKYYPHKDALFILKNIAEKSYRKITGGPLNAKLGNIALESLVKYDSIEAYGVMGTMLAKSKYSVFQRALKSRMKKFKALLKEYTAEELEDIVVPDYNIIENIKKVIIGSYEAHIILSQKGIATSYLKDEKTIKTAPKEIRDNFPLELKSLRADIKSIKESLLAQAKRLESSYLAERTWTESSWSKNILQHSLMSFLASKLIWCKTEDLDFTFTIADKKIINSSRKKIKLSDNDSIRLWHPALSRIEITLEWRDYLFENQIQQPFKQAFREVYLLTPAENMTNDHSLRFNGHHLKGNTLYSLGKTRQWKMSYDQPPFYVFPNRKAIAVLNIVGGVLYSNCTTKDIRFYTYSTKPDIYNRSESMNLSDLPTVLFSEIMRDVDLFVAISGLAYDPHFNTTGDKELMGYWQDAAFGKKSNTPIASIRKDLLERLLPKTKVRNHFSFKGNFLVIQGKRNFYKINLGSSNILIEPQDRYLCIVPGNPASDKNLKKIWLPFEGGDRTLMTIISKAFLLLDDDNITDTSITRQL